MERLVVTVVGPVYRHLNAYLRSYVSMDCPGSREPNQMMGSIPGSFVTDWVWMDVLPVT